MKKFLIYALCTLSLAAMACACNDRPDINGNYGFSVEYLPVQKKIVRGETAEIRLKLVREERWEDARYRMRYFQPDGRGVLRDEQGTVFKPNDLYDLTAEEFRLYYTSQSEDQQTIDLYFIDNFNKMVTLSFSFNNEREDE